MRSELQHQIAITSQATLHVSMYIQLMPCVCCLQASAANEEVFLAMKCRFRDITGGILPGMSLSLMKVLVLHLVRRGPGLRKVHEQGCQLLLLQDAGNLCQQP